MALYPEGTAPLPLDDVQRAANKANELSRQGLGQNGATVLSGATGATGNFVSVHFLAATALSGITAPGITNASSLIGNYVAGQVIYGDIREVVITSGLAIAYNS